MKACLIKTLSIHVYVLEIGQRLVSRYRATTIPKISNMPEVPLTLLINQCLHTVVYPSQLKMSRVKPLFKSGDKSLFNNYRPISLLPSLSKIFERVIFDQLLAYFTNNNLLCLNQFGFRPGHSTELAALRLVDHLITEMDRNRVPTNIYIDLSKTFDTLNHFILLEKLEYYGIADNSLSLLHNYLTDRCQYVEYNGHRSNTLPISTGVPRGSVLGPLSGAFQFFRGGPSSENS